MSASVQQPHPLVTSPVIPHISESRNQFQYGMTNFRPNSCMMSNQGNRSQQEISFMQQMNNPNFCKTHLYFVLTSEYCTHV